MPKEFHTDVDLKAGLLFNGVAVTAAGKALLDDVDAAAQRATLGLGTLATQSAIVDADISASAEIAVSKLADGTARQLLQTDAAGTGVEWTSNVDIPGTLDVTGATTLDSTLSFPLGSAGSPSIYPGSDTNTGIWSPAADTLAVSTGGVERLRTRSDGNIGIGGSGSNLVTFYNQGPTTGGSTAYANLTSTAIQSDVTGTALCYSATANTAAASFTLSSLHYYSANQGTIGASSSITNQFGFIANNTLTGATNNFGFYGNIAAAAGRYNFYAAGTANNYFAGNTGIGSAGATSISLSVSKNITGGTNGYGVISDGQVQSDVTGTALGYYTNLKVANATFTLASLAHYYAAQGTIGASATVTNQYGFFVESTITGATNNFGFVGNLASATGRWNFYAGGTAPNYFAGDIRTNTVVTKKQAPTNSNVTATATAASLLDGIRTGTPAADIDLQVPTGTNMDAAFQDLQTNQSFEWSVINLATAASGFDITVTANTGHTVVGNMRVTGETSSRFLTRKTAANTFITYRIG